MESRPAPTDSQAPSQRTRTSTQRRVKSSVDWSPFSFTPEATAATSASSGASFTAGFSGLSASSGSSGSFSPAWRGVSSDPSEGSELPNGENTV